MTAVDPPPSRPLWAIGLLLGLALPLTGYLALSLTILGLDKYFYILAGGKKFATFPNLTSHLSISVVYLALVILHALWVIGSDRVYRFANFAPVLRISWIFLLLALLAYPLGNDVYLYLHAGLMNWHGVDPFLTPAGNFLSPLSPFVDWKQTSTYGPISQVLFAGVAIAVPLHPIVAVYLLKIVCLLVHGFNGWLVWRILPEPHRGKGAIAYLLTPVLLIEQVASAHVDVLVSTSLLLTAWCLFQRRYATAFLALWGGLLAKTIPLLWMPLLGLFLIRQRRWKHLALGIVASLAIALLLSMTVLPTPASWRSLLNPGVTGQLQSSIPALIRAGLETLPYFRPEAPPPSQYKYWLLDLSRYLLGGFVVFYAWTCLRLFRRHYTTAHLLEDMGWVTLVLMLYATAWLMPWYVSILYAIAIVLPHATRFNLTVFAFGVSSSAMYLLHLDAGLRSLCAIGLPTLVLLLTSIWPTKPDPRSKT